MSTLYFGFSILGLLLIVRWFIKNDGRSPTRGLLAMKEVKDSAEVLPRSGRE